MVSLPLIDNNLNTFRLWTIHFKVLKDVILEFYIRQKQIRKVPKLIVKVNAM